MSRFKKIIFIVLFLFILSCRPHDANTILVGTIAGPETELMQVAKKVAAEKYNLTIKIVTFSDYLQPNMALVDKSIDANLFQHKPWLDQQNRDHHYNLVIIGRSFVYPMGVYSKKISSIKNLKEGSVVSIPNDPSNEGRALLLLQKMGLLKLKARPGLYASQKNIVSNPKKLKLKELDAAQLPRSLADVDLSVINANFALEAGLSPIKDALYVESSNSLYANVIVVRKADAHDPRFKKLVAACQDDEVVQAANKIFLGNAIPGWLKN